MTDETRNRTRKATMNSIINGSLHVRAKHYSEHEKNERTMANIFRISTMLYPN